jgi:hypothetical protein
MGLIGADRLPGAWTEPAVDGPGMEPFRFQTLLGLFNLIWREFGLLYSTGFLLAARLTGRGIKRSTVQQGEEKRDYQHQHRHPPRRLGFL